MENPRRLYGSVEGRGRRWRPSWKSLEDFDPWEGGREWKDVETSTKASIIFHPSMKASMEASTPSTGSLHTFHGSLHTFHRSLQTSAGASTICYISVKDPVCEGVVSTRFTDGKRYPLCTAVHIAAEYVDAHSPQPIALFDVR